MNKPKVGVIGLGGQSAFLSAGHFPAPGETVSCSELFFELGGKGYNQAIACARMGVPTVFVGAVGDDDNGEACRRELEAEGITACLIKKKIPTAFAVITTAQDGENTVSVFGGAAKQLQPEDLRTAEVLSQLKDCTYLLLQNELSAECLLEACRIGQEQEIPVIFNPAPAEGVPAEIMKQCAFITPNYGEAMLLTGIASDEKPSGERLAAVFCERGISNAVITMGSRGAIVMEQGNVRQIPVFSPGKTVDTTGAGDTFNGYLTAGLAMGMGLYEAAGLAAVAAGIAVTRPGAAGSIPARAEVDAHYFNHRL